MPDIERIITQNVLRGLPVGLLVVDQTGSIVVANPASGRILGYGVEDILGRGWGELFFHNDANYLFNQIFVEVIQNELVELRRDAPYVTPDGETLHLSITSSYLQDDNAQAGIVVILNDITELTRMQRRETEILKEKNRIQEDKIKCLNGLASSVAHQIRNPTFAISGFASRLGKLLDKHDIDSTYPGIILEEAGKLENIVKAVNRFSTLADLRLTNSSLLEVVQTARDNALARRGDAGVAVAWSLTPPDVIITADCRLLASALCELFVNSIDFCGRDTLRINLDGRARGLEIHLDVLDDGPGVNPRDIPYIFDPFYSSKSQASGMGLTLVQEIILEHNGDIRLDETHRPGARFSIRLPLFPSHLVSRLDDTEP